jgi:hypothetical protein
MWWGGPEALKDWRTWRVGKGPSSIAGIEGTKGAPVRMGRTPSENQIPKKPAGKKSIISVLFMSLLDGKDLLDNHQLFLFIDIVKYRVAP